MADDKPRRYKPSEQPKGWALKKKAKAKKKKPGATVTMSSVIRGGPKTDTVSGGNPGTKKKPKSTAKKINKNDIPKSVRDEVDAHFKKLKAQRK